MAKKFGCCYTYTQRKVFLNGMNAKEAVLKPRTERKDLNFGDR